MAHLLAPFLPSCMRSWAHNGESQLGTYSAEAGPDGQKSGDFAGQGCDLSGQGYYTRRVSSGSAHARNDMGVHAVTKKGTAGTLRAKVAVKRKKLTILDFSTARGCDTPAMSPPASECEY
jgi:hypothetical protein